MCDPAGSGSLTRDGLYKSLALAAVAQEGRTVEERALKSYQDSGEVTKYSNSSGHSLMLMYSVQAFTFPVSVA